MFTKDHVTQSSHEDKKYNSAHQEQASYRSTCATMYIIGYDSTKKLKLFQINLGGGSQC